MNIAGLARLCSAAAFAIALPVHAETDPDGDKMPNAPMREQVMYLTVDPSGPVKLEATLFEPPGDGPFPLAVMNHGAHGDPRTATRYRVSLSIDYLLSRGYAVIAPMMRGFSDSDGKAAGIDGCDAARTGRENALDILAVIANMKERQEIDATRVLVMGQSFGGWNSVALSTIATPEVKGIINFVGGMRAGHCADQDTALWKAMEEFGRESRVPSLWFYGDKDTIFPPSVWRVCYERFTRAGGHAKLVDFGDVDDAHNLLGHSDRIDLWLPEVDAYLGERGLPNQSLYPEYMPTPRPQHSNYAAIEDIDAVPVLGRKNPDYYRKFLKESVRPRVLMISDDFASIQTGGFDPVARGFADCAAKAKHCAVYAFDDDVVWTGPEPGHAARVNDVVINGRAAKSGEPSVIQKLVALTPACEPKPLPTASVAVAPAHGVATIEEVEDVPSFKDSSELKLCNGTQVPMLRLTYRSEAQYHGVDFFSLSVTEAGKDERITKFAIHVD